MNGVGSYAPRMLPESLATAIDVSSWPVPPIFRMLRDIGDVPEEDWRRTLNLGIGMILDVGEKDAVRAERILRKMNEPYHTVGRVIKMRRGGPRVEYQ